MYPPGWDRAGRGGARRGVLFWCEVFFVCYSTSYTPKGQARSGGLCFSILCYTFPFTHTHFGNGSQESSTRVEPLLPMLIKDSLLCNFE